MMEESGEVVVQETKVSETEMRKKFPYVRTTSSKIPIAEFAESNGKELDITQELIDIAKQKIPKEATDSPQAYIEHIEDEVRLRVQYPGYYKDLPADKKDPIFEELSKNAALTDANRADVLICLEVRAAQRKNAANRKTIDPDDLKKDERRLVYPDVVVDDIAVADGSGGTTKVAGSTRRLSGEAERLFKEEQVDKKPSEQIKDSFEAVYAFTLLADQLLDEKFPWKGRLRTYRSVLKELQGEKADAGNSGRIASEITQVRKMFYDDVHTALRLYGKQSESPNSMQQRIAEVFQDYKESSIAYETKHPKKKLSLVDFFVGVGKAFTSGEYKGVGYTGRATKETKLRSINREKIRATLGDSLTPDELVDMAFRGVDLFRRRISEKNSGVEERYVSGKKLVKEKEQGADKGEELPQGDGKPDKPPKEEEPPEDSPAEDDHPHTDDKITDHSGHVLPLLESFNLAIVATPDRIEQNLMELTDSVFSHDRTKFPQPKSAVGKILQPLRHPIKYIWQNALFRPIFEQQAMRFSADAMQTVKDVIGIDRTIPLHIGQQLVIQSLSEGAKLRSKKGLKRVGYWLQDKFAGITGIGQTSEQLLAKEWLKTAGKEVILKLKEGGLKEQTALGLEYSIVEQKEGQSFAQCVAETNRHLISTTLGEKRYDLKSLVSPGANESEGYRAFNKAVKDAITLFATSETPDQAALVAAVNKAYRAHVFLDLPREKQKELYSSELGSNIIPIAEAVRQRKADYLTAGADGKTKLDSLEINYLVGRREWGGVRSKQEVGSMTHLLAKRIAEKQVGLADGTRLAGVSTAKWITDAAKDVLIYGGSYVVGGLALTPRAAWGSLKTGLHLSPIGGALATALTAGVKEGGIVIARDGKLYGAKGRYLKEFQQVAREYASGSEKQDKAPIRNEFVEKAMVDCQDASELTKKLQALIHQESLSPEDEKKLIMHVAHAKARMRLTDLSSKRDGLKLNISQNFIRFNEGLATQEMAALRGSVAESIIKLHRSSPNQATLDTRLAETQVVLEAQLRVGNEVEKVTQVVSRELGRSTAEVKAMVTQFLQQAAADGIKFEGKSLHSAMENLSKLNARRGWTTAGKVAIISPVAGFVGKLGYEEVARAVHDVQAHGDILSGLGQYASSWKKTIIDGEIPLKEETLGGVTKVVTDATPLQQGLLQARAFVEPPIGEFWHRQTLDNAVINFNAGVRYGEFNGHHYISDMRSGEVVDLGQNHFDVQGGKLVLVDPSNHSVDADAYFNGKLTVGKGPDIQEFHEVKKTVMTSGAATTIDKESAFAEHSVKTDHREWYSYDKPGSQGNELTAYTYKSGDSVTVDYSKMGEAWQHGLNPEHINVQDMLKNPQNYDGQLGMYVTIPGHPGEGMFIPDFDHTGKIVFDPHDTVHTITFDNGSTMTMADASKLLVNQEALQKLQDGNIATELYGHRDVWNFGANGQAGYGMVGRLVNHDGKPVFQSFATLEGTAQVQAVSIVPDQIPTEQITQEAITRETFNIVGKPFELNPDFVPIPLYWRQNVERSEKRREIPEGYEPMKEVKSFNQEVAPPVDIPPIETHTSHDEHQDDHSHVKRLDEELYVDTPEAMQKYLEERNRLAEVFDAQLHNSGVTSAQFKSYWGIEKPDRIDLKDEAEVIHKRYHRETISKSLFNSFSGEQRTALEKFMSGTLDKELMNWLNEATELAISNATENEIHDAIVAGITAGYDAHKDSLERAGINLTAAELAELLDSAGRILLQLDRDYQEEKLNSVFALFTKWDEQNKTE